MTKKLDTTPNGMICTCCGQDKDEYHFYSRLGKSYPVTKFFFVNPDFAVTRCWECNGDYRCLGCGEIKAASQFRVGGRFCQSCKDAGIYKVLTEAYLRPITEADGDSLNSENSAESEFSE